MTAMTAVQRAIELLSVPVGDIAAWLADQPDLVFVAAGEREVDAVLDRDGDGPRVIAADGPELAVRAGIPEDRAQHASWDIRAVEQRARTLERVLAPLVERQRGYLFDGAAEPRAVSVFELIAATGMHSGPIRRALAGKRVRTPRGVLDPSTWITGARALRGQVEDIEEYPDYGERAERVLLRGEGGELFVLLSDASTGWERGDEIEIDEERLTSGLHDAALEATLMEKPAATLTLGRAA
jgi:hypothetical protein